jgi:hypothetical protein
MPSLILYKQLPSFLHSPVSFWLSRFQCGDRSDALTQDGTSFSFLFLVKGRGWIRYLMYLMYSTSKWEALEKQETAIKIIIVVDDQGSYMYLLYST